MVVPSVSHAGPRLGLPHRTAGTPRPTRAVPLADATPQSRLSPVSTVPTTVHPTPSSVSPPTPSTYLRMNILQRRAEQGLPGVSLARRGGPHAGVGHSGHKGDNLCRRPSAAEWRTGPAVGLSGQSKVHSARRQFGCTDAALRMSVRGALTCSSPTEWPKPAPHAARLGLLLSCGYRLHRQKGLPVDSCRTMAKHCPNRDTSTSAITAEPYGGVRLGPSCEQTRVTWASRRGPLWGLVRLRRPMIRHPRKGQPMSAMAFPPFGP